MICILMLGCEGLWKWKTSSFVSLLCDVIHRPVNSNAAVSLIQFIFSLTRISRGNDSEIYITGLGFGEGFAPSTKRKSIQIKMIQRGKKIQYIRPRSVQAYQSTFFWLDLRDDESGNFVWFCVSFFSISHSFEWEIDSFWTWFFIARIQSFSNHNTLFLCGSEFSDVNASVHFVFFTRMLSLPQSCGLYASE